MTKAALPLLAALQLTSGGSLRDVNEFSVLDYRHRDGVPAIAGKTLVNVVPWTVAGAGSTFFMLCALAPEAMVAAVGELTSR
jgi:hypothetical protein